MAELGDHQEDALALQSPAQREGHVEGRRDPREVGLQGRELVTVEAGEPDPHEEADQSPGRRTADWR